MLTLSFDDVSCGLGCPLAAAIDKPPLSTNKNSPITCERCAIDRNFVLNTDRKQWSLCRLVTSLPGSDVTDVKLRNRYECGEYWRIIWM
jgi:hypothetical protein